MTRSDIGIIAIIYATCLLFLCMTLQLKAAAQIYPLCLIGGLALLNTLYLVRCLLRLRGARLLNDLPQVFSGFFAGQFFFVVIASVLYVAVMHWIGFYPAGLLYMLAVMLRLRVPPLHMALTLATLGILIYAVFTLFLKVPLPRGVLFG